MPTTVSFYDAKAKPKAQKACDDAVASMCGAMVARYNVHRNNFDHWRKIANGHATSMAGEAGQLSQDGCGTFKVPSTIAW